MIFLAAGIQVTDAARATSRGEQVATASIEVAGVICGELVECPVIAIGAGRLIECAAEIVWVIARPLANSTAIIFVATPEINGIRRYVGISFEIACFTSFVFVRWSKVPIVYDNSVGDFPLTLIMDIVNTSETRTIESLPVPLELILFVIVELQISL